MGKARSPEMVELDREAVCPSCQAVVSVGPDWRLVQCPRCGAMITRMGEDSSYD
jgi:predicted RNA-binding Zn-ribbon protein involved in translation (DUF1610 family)